MNKVIPFAVFTLNRLNIKAPPAEIFETLIGYTGEQRFIGFCYTGHTLSIDDGQINEIGHKRPWSIWYRSMGIEILKHYCFGYEGRAPEHMLILDRVSRVLYAGPVLRAQAALRQQIPRLPETAERTLLEENEEVARQDLTDEVFHFGMETNSDCQARMIKGIKKLEMWVEISKVVTEMRGEI